MPTRSAGGQVSRELVALLNDQEVGRVRQEQTGRLRFVYNAAWREQEGAYPLSLSLPLVQGEHGDGPVRAYLAGLLPDNDRILARWGQRFGVSPRNPLALLAHVGEDCAGAVQFVTPERMDELQSAPIPEAQWLSEPDIAERLRLLAADQAAWREPGDTGQFSLAGAQPKTAFLQQNGRWGVPAGRTPTTHILKPPVAGFDGFAENEHVCLRLARALRLPAARSEVMRFEEQIAIVVERYDRRMVGDRFVRIHQEDFCQALGVLPAIKYESEGGPGVAAIAGVLREHSGRPEVDVATLLGALALNWVIGGTDAHAKNFSILIGVGGRVRLAPLYDIASALPVSQLERAEDQVRDEDRRRVRHATNRAPTLGAPGGLGHGRP